MTHFEFFIVIAVLRSFIPRFVKRQSMMEVYFKDWIDTPNEWKGLLSLIVYALINFFFMWMAAGYLLPYFNHYVSLE